MSRNILIRKTICFSCVSVLAIFILFGCTENRSYILQNENQGDLSVANKSQITDVICDDEGKVLVEFESDGSLFLLDNYILFSKEASKSSESNRMKDYFCLNLETKEYSYLGTIEYYGTSTFMGTAANNCHLYSFVFHGNPFDGDWTDDEELRLYDFDLEAKTITHIRTSKYKHPYNDLQAYENKLLIKDGNQIVEFDLKSKEDRILLSYPEFDSEEMQGEMVYACFMNTDTQQLSVVVIRVNGEKHTTLRIDTYDGKMQQISSIDISKEASLTGEVEFSMLGQVVTDFFVKGKYFYYSQSAYHIFGKKEEQGAVFLISRDNQEYELVREISEFSETRCFGVCVFDGIVRENRIFKLNLNTGECFWNNREIGSEDEQILGAMRNSNGIILVQVVTSETTYDDIRRYYLLEESELQFELCEENFRFGE